MKASTSHATAAVAAEHYRIHQAVAEQGGVGSHVLGGQQQQERREASHMQGGLPASGYTGGGAGSHVQTGQQQAAGVAGGCQPCLGWAAGSSKKGGCRQICGGWAATTSGAHWQLCTGWAAATRGGQMAAM